MIRNLTPHAITILREGDPLTIPADPAGPARSRPSSGTVTDLVTATELGISVVTTAFGPVEGLPAPQDGVILVVSGLVLDHPDTAHRTDLAAPGELVRGPDGQPTGCRGLRVRR
jgi:hypothetical protein